MYQKLLDFLINPLSEQNSYYPHFTEEKTEADRGWVTNSGATTVSASCWPEHVWLGSLTRKGTLGDKGRS